MGHKSYMFGYYHGLEAVCASMLAGSRRQWVIDPDTIEHLNTSATYTALTAFDLWSNVEDLGSDGEKFVEGYVDAYDWAIGVLRGMSPSDTLKEAAARTIPIGLVDQRTKDMITGRAHFLEPFLDIDRLDYYVGLSHGDKQSDYWVEI